MEPGEMGTGEAYSGFSPSAYGAPVPYVQPMVPPPVLPPVPQFRPLSTGEVLDRTFSLYRQRFWLFAGISMLPAAVLLVSSAVRLLFLTMTHQTGLLQPKPASPQDLGNAMGSLVLLQVYLIPASILFIVAFGISHAATVDAVNRVARGMDASVGISYREVRGRWLRWLGIVFRQVWSAVWPSLPGLVAVGAGLGMLAVPSLRGNLVLTGSLFALAWALLVAGSIFGVLNFLRNTLAVAAGVSENLGVNAAMRRSKMLVAGRKGRLFLAWLMIYALQMVVAAVELPLVFAAMNLRGGAFIAVQAIVMLVQFLAVALVAPVASIAFTLFYIDERVRREGFDIELLMQRTLPHAVVVPVPEI